MTKDNFFSMTKDNLAIPDFGNNGIIQSVPLDPLLRSLTVRLFLQYHLLPERRVTLQSPRTRPRKSTCGNLFAVGGVDSAKSKEYF